MNKLLKILSPLVILALLGGCATMADSVNAKGTGTSRVYNQPFDTVWNGVIEVITNSKLDLVSKDKESGQILAQRGMTAFSYGENVAVFVEKVGKEVKTRVEVVSKKALAPNITGANWEKRLFTELDAKFGQ